MYLLDINIWLERLLAQEQAEAVGQLLDIVPTNQLMMSDITLHSIGMILGRLGQGQVFTQFVQDVLIEGEVILISLPPAAMLQIAAVMERDGLDFDDGYQYVVAEREDAVIVSFDGDFDRTERGRSTPEQVLATLE